MEQFEKVRKGLEHCKTDDCSGCPYEYTTAPVGKFGTDELVDCQHVLHSDALSMIWQQQERIREQTARVMSLEEAIEVVSKDGGIVWIEQKCHPLDTAHVLPTNHICDSPQRKFQDYGKEFVPKRYSYRYMWRCWTSWPTDEQRKAVPWE